MLCFHGYGMHGRQFSLLEKSFGHLYTFYGFDLLFHEKTRLADDSLKTLQAGLKKQDLTDVLFEFCTASAIEKFSLIAYSMGTHYAACLIEKYPERIDTYIAIAPSFLQPVKFLKFLGTSKIANKLLENMVFSESAMHRLLKITKSLGLVNQEGYDILFREIKTPELRFSFYACITYLRFLMLDSTQFIQGVNRNKILVVFIFGSNDKSYPADMNDKLVLALENSGKIIIQGGHDLINNSLIRYLQPYLS